MKRIILIAALALIAISPFARAQGNSCNIPCCQQSFPYEFCNSDGTDAPTRCSTNPNADGIPAKSFIPGCVNIENAMPADGLMQPNAIPPKPASYLGDDYFLSKYTSTDSFNYYAGYGGSLQQGIDSVRFTENKPPQDPRNDPTDYLIMTDPGDEPSCCPDCPPDQYGGDSCQQWVIDKTWWYYFLGAEDQYAADEEAWAANQAAYTTVWDQTQAGTDAKNALDAWLNSCQPPIAPSDPTCCLNVLLDNNANDFGTQANVTLAKTPLPHCGESTCAEMQARILKVNISDAFLNQSRQTDQGPLPSEYTLHTVHYTSWYTDPTKAPNLMDAYGAFSFFQIMEHEIGHILGLDHPEDLNYSCNNCYTTNPVVNASNVLNPTGYHTIMAQQLNVPANSSLIAPLTLSDEDHCQFQKLYCPDNVDWSLCSNGVHTQKNEDTGPYPEIYPNPSTGAAELDYTVKDRSFVQIAIYDMLGNMVSPVSSDYEEIGSYKISLGTESLPSGHYVCRIRVGETVTYLNLVIER
ncbi:MAG TPA: zinc-dependent metalloprotease, partial [Candidatus Kapabacteria bacterium]|nr:zinc-dependent metalloprotease [Candidatus Kapabacteria bacterium]